MISKSKELMEPSEYRCRCKNKYIYVEYEVFDMRDFLPSAHEQSTLSFDSLISEHGLNYGY